MAIIDIEKCNCDRTGCEFVDHTGDHSTSYSREELVEMVEGLEHLLILLKYNKKCISKNAHQAGATNS